MPALYYRRPSEPGGDDDIIAEVVDGELRRRIEISGGVAHCTGYDDYPVTIDMSAVADYVWPISEQEFNDAWLRHCFSRERGAALRQPRRAGRRGDRRR